MLQQMIGQGHSFHPLRRHKSTLRIEARILAIRIILADNLMMRHRLLQMMKLTCQATSIRREEE